MILDKIILKTKDDLKQKKELIPISLLNQMLKNRDTIDPKNVIYHLKSTNKNPYRIIAEVKKASPSKGIIREDFEPVKIAKEYELGKADALSILTEPHFFLGKLEYLEQIKKHVKIPLLRKDFIVDKYQIVEAAAFGADFILLIAKALDKKTLKLLFEFSKSFGLEVLVEIHDMEDLEKALFVNANIIGINHRNLKTFKMDMTLSSKLIPFIPKGKIIVAESGISDKKTIQLLSGIGVDAFLIGEHFMRQNDITSELLKIKCDL